MATVSASLVILALVISFSIDWANTSNGGAVDFRNRITGVRLMEHGVNAWRFIWHEGDPPEYCDLRNNPRLPVSKTTVTPALLLLHAPFADVPYRRAQFLWLILQWLLLLATGWIWWRSCDRSLTSWLVVMFVTGLTFTQGWRWEAERGQSYLLLAFLFAGWLTMTKDPRRNRDFAAGALAGFLVPLRPPFLLLLPFIAVHRRSQVPGVIAGLVVGIGLPLLINPSSWTDYFSAMQTNADLYRHGPLPARPPQNFPPVIEGTPTTTLGHLMPFPFGDFSAYALLRSLGLTPFPAWPLLFTVAALFTGWLAWSRKEFQENLLPGLAAWFFIADLFLPDVRYSYYDLLIINVVLASLVTGKGFPCAAWPCFLALPVSWAIYFWSPIPHWMLFLPPSLFTLGAVLAVLLFDSPYVGKTEPSEKIPASG